MPEPDTSNRSVPWLLALVLAVLGIKYIPAPSADTAREPRAAEARPGDSHGSEAEGGGKGGLREVLPAAEEGEREYLIATLPDPFDSSSGYWFDTGVDTIQRAAETQFYGLDRYYYPWKQKSKDKESAPARLTGDGVPQGPAAAEREPAYRREPGVLVFRRPRQDGVPHLVVFLVGETATKGIHQGAFRVALNEVQKGAPGQPIRILGPFFSGSAHSLHEGVGAWKKSLAETLAGRCVAAGGSLGPVGAPFLAACALGRVPAPAFRIITGSARTIDGRSFTDHFPGRDVEFATTVHSESIFRKVLVDFTVAIAGVGVDPSKVAILLEVNTAIGKEYNKRFEAEPFRAKPERGPLVLPFPLHVSDIRAAYNQNATGTEPPLPSLPSFAARLRIPVNEGPGPVDTEPSVTPGMTAATTERILAQMLAVLSRERIKWVVILATDLKDKIFLATLIRQELPDVGLTVTGGDILLSHPDHRYYFQGALIASTYPLYPKNQHWSFPGQGRVRRLILPGESACGVYNAAVALLARPDCLQRDLEYLLEYGPPFTATPPVKDDQPGWAPPVWLTALGADGPHPLHYAVPRRSECRPDEEQWYDEGEAFLYRANVPYRAGKPNELPADAKFKAQYPGFWVWPFILFLVVCIAAFFWKTRRFFKPPGAAGRFRALEIVWPLWVGRPHEPGPYPYVLVCAAALATVCAYVLRYVVGPPVVLSFSHSDVLEAPEFSDYVMPGLALLVTLWLLWISVITLGAWCRSASALGRLAAAILLLISGVLLWRSPAEGSAFRVPLSLVPALLAGGLLAGPLLALAAGAPVSRARAVWAFWCVWAVILAVPPWLAGLCLVKSAFTLNFWLAASLLLVLVTTAVWSVVLDVGQRFPLRAAGVVVWLAVLCLGRSVLAAPGNFPFWDPVPDALLLVERASNLGSGVSPVLPLVWLALAFYSLAYWQLKRWEQLPAVAQGSPFPVHASDSRLTDLAAQRRRIHDLLLQPAARILGERRRTALAVLAVLLFVFCRVYSKFCRAEGPVHDCLYLLALAAFVLFLAFVFGQAKYLWDEISKLLDGITGLPMLTAFDRIPSTVTGMFGPYLSSPGPDRRARRGVRAQQLRALAELYPEVRVALYDLLWSRGGKDLDALDKALRYQPKRLACEDVNMKELEEWTPSGGAGGGDDPLVSPARAVLGVLQWLWPDRTVEEAYGAAPKEGSSLDKVSEPPPGPASSDVPLPKWLRMAEDFVALEITADLSRLFVQLRNLSRSLTWAPLLAVLALVSYPFHPQRLLLLVAGVMILILLGGAVKVLLQIERNALVSRIRGGTAHQVDWSWGLAGRLALHLVPLLGLLAAASMDSSNLLHIWLDPIYQVLR
jgi:hypothetical protein